MSCVYQFPYSTDINKFYMQTPKNYFIGGCIFIKLIINNQLI